MRTHVAPAFAQLYNYNLVYKHLLHMLLFFPVKRFRVVYQPFAAEVALT